MSAQPPRTPWTPAVALARKLRKELADLACDPSVDPVGREILHRLESEASEHMNILRRCDPAVHVPITPVEISEGLEQLRLRIQALVDNPGDRPSQGTMKELVDQVVRLRNNANELVSELAQERTSSDA